MPDDRTPLDPPQAVTSPQSLNVQSSSTQIDVSGDLLITQRSWLADAAKMSFPDLFYVAAALTTGAVGGVCLAALLGRVLFDLWGVLIRHV
jgi:hypothetical protein